MPKLYLSKPLLSEQTFTSGMEGPAVDAEGNVYAVNFGKQGTIGKVSPEGIASLFVELPQGSIGNGICIDKEGFLYVADYSGHNILKISSKTKAISVLAHEPRMNQPNDIALMDNGILFASDPNWQNNTGQLWRITPDGKTSLLEENMGTTNGIEVSPDNTKLYVNESVQRNVWQYDLSSTGEVSNKRLLVSFPDFGLDGMRCDAKGNLYATRFGKGTVVQLAPDGTILKEITVHGAQTTNIAFGGKDGKTAYVTLMDKGNFATFRVTTEGRAFHWLQKK